MLNLKAIQSTRVRVTALVLGLTALLLPFQNCILSSMVGKAADVSSSSGPSSGAAGISPSAVQLSWEGVATSTSYNVYNMNLGSKPVTTTVFTTARISGLDPDTKYAFSVRGSRGTGQYLTDSLGTYIFNSWPLFTDVVFNVAPEDDSSQTISWNYAPWSGSTLPASPDAERGSIARCSFVPVPAGTDPTTINLASPVAGVTPLTIPGRLFDQKLNLPLGSIDSSLTYAAQCTAVYVDGTLSPSTHNFLVNPAHLINPCASSALIATSYSCSPNLRIPSLSQVPTYTLRLADSNTCTWARVVGTDIQSTGTLTAANIGTCSLEYRYLVQDPSYESPIVKQNVTVSVPDSFKVYPSFAVRALSGAIGFPHLYSKLRSTTDQRALVRGDLISDFGYGSSFFAGGSTPFPVMSPSTPTLPSTMFYGFPVSPVVNGVRPTGYSLDAIRPTWQSTDPSVEGYMRGNLVIPHVQVTNSAFLTATGTTTSQSLFDFLTNQYTFDGGSNYSPSSLAYFLNTISDRDISGDPVSNTWAGTTIEQTSVKFNLPTAQAILNFMPPTGIKGSGIVFANADASKTITGLVTAPANNSLFYVANCQNSPSDFANPVACVPATGTPLPTAISCSGDIIVNAPLLLVNPTIFTDAKGCRIHATGTIFVQGQITVLNTDGTANVTGLQLMSSRAVVLGFSLQSLGVSNSGTRTGNGGGILDQLFANGSTNPFLTSVANGPGAASAALNAVAQDASVVGIKPLDISTQLASGTQTFTHLTIASPYVFSNYSGALTGSLIAEVIAFPFLKFETDSALIGQTPFPLFTGSAAPLVVTQ